MKLNDDDDDEQLLSLGDDECYKNKTIDQLIEESTKKNHKPEHNLANQREEESVSEYDLTDYSSN